ncbi:MAG: polysaccharide biosynthesis protein [Clostridiaceae bacterium]|nr:polysaccharide biosynthesis protein [Clostridiaceae bacterium]
MSKIQKQSFLEGALIMAIANMIVKVIGAFFKIPLKNLIGSDGMGMFYGAYNIYSALVVISTAGLPVAVSRMIAEANAKGRGREIDRIFRVSFGLFIAIGVLSTLLMIAFARPLLAYQGNPDAYWSLIALAPAVFFVALMSVYRGYCQGLRNMVPTAVSQLIEAASKLVFGYGLAILALKLGYGVEIASAGAILGVTFGTVLGSIYVAIRRKRVREVSKFSDFDPDIRTDTELLKTLIVIAIPITIGAAVMSLTNLIDNFVVMRRLQAIGFAKDLTVSMYGAYSSMSVALMTLPQTLIVGMTVSLIPAIADAYGAKDYQRARINTESATRLTGVLAFPCAAGLFVLAWPLLNLLFTADVDFAAPLLQTLAFAFLFVSLVSVTNALLQAAGKERLPVISMVVGGVVKLVTNFILIGTPAINIHGAPIGTIACYATIAILNIIFVYTKTELGPKQWYLLWKPLASAIAMGAFAYITYPPLAGLLGARLGVLVDIFLCVAVYLGVMLLLGGFVREDILMLPKGKKIARFLRLK